MGGATRSVGRAHNFRSWRYSAAVHSIWNALPTDMAPKPLRQVTRKSAATLPTTQTAKFLFASAQESAESCPQLAAVLGRRCLQVRAPVPEGERQQSMCR